MPLLATSRIGASLNYNAPNAIVYTCEASGANNQNVDNTGVLSNPVVQNLVYGYLTQANAGATVDPPARLARGQAQTSPISGEKDGDYHRLELLGVKHIQVSNGTSDGFPDSVQRYDSKNDGVVDKWVKPTADMQGEDTTDQRAPKVKVTSELEGVQNRVIIRAKDNVSKVARIVCSLDGQHFQMTRQGIVPSHTGSN